MSVLTASDREGLKPMAAGLVKRHSDAGVSPPTVLYVDHDCHRGIAKETKRLLSNSQGVESKIQERRTSSKNQQKRACDPLPQKNPWCERNNLLDPWLDWHIPRWARRWDFQKRHIACIQDPDEVQLYIKTGAVTKGGAELPLYRCTRGSMVLKLIMDCFSLNCVNNKMLVYDWFLTAHIYSFILLYNFKTVRFDLYDYQKLVIGQVKSYS